LTIWMREMSNLLARICLVHSTTPNLSITSYTNGSIICARNSPSNYAGTMAYLQDNCSIVQSFIQRISDHQWHLDQQILIFELDSTFIQRSIIGNICLKRIPKKGISDHEIWTQ
jgi:hypothetical protein